MSDPLGHECGVALVRLRKPLAHYEERYGTPLWGFFKLFLLMEKQHNRGQDGAGIANARMNAPEEVWEHAQLKARNRWREIDTPAGRIPALLPPVTSARLPRNIG